MEEAEPFRDTQIYDILLSTNLIYQEIADKQKNWQINSPSKCPSSCGTCCLDFEPDVFECEALYLGAWLLFHNKPKALEIASNKITIRTEHPTGCFLFDEFSNYHCTVYNGRTSICRLFGYSADKGKNNELRWKPCKFLPISKLENGIIHKQYNQNELLEKFHALPPIMSDSMQQLVGLETSNTATEPLRIALPKAINKLLMILQFREPPEPNSPEPLPSNFSSAA